MTDSETKVVHMLDYGAGNVRSVRNAVTQCGYQVVDVTSPEQLETVEKLIFPGVGNFASAATFLHEKGYAEPLRKYLASGKHFLGICLGMQTLFEGSEECPGVAGLGVIKGTVGKFQQDKINLSVPHIGWNTVKVHKQTRLMEASKWDGEKQNSNRVYFVHSFRAMPTEENKDWVLCTTGYGTEYISAVQKGNVMATQFHPEKSGELGLDFFRGFLERTDSDGAIPIPGNDKPAVNGLSKRVIACLDVRSNDQGDLVVTKGESYDVREPENDDSQEPATKKASTDAAYQNTGKVRNLGKPVDLAARYFSEGADEVTFLNITSFRSEPLEDTPMLQVLEEASKRVFVPLTIGGGIRNYTDKAGVEYSALEVAARYFRAGADKVSIGSDAVVASLALLKTGKLDGTSAIEQISKRYGAQAVVISVDPRRVYLANDEEVDAAKKHGYTIVQPTIMEVEEAKASNTEAKPYWYQCTVKGGREGRDIDAVQLAQCCERLGAGEILLNSIDMDGQGKGFDLQLVRAVCNAVSLPVIASSGAGKPEHFSQVFRETRAEAALAAGIFHRKEVPLSSVKDHLVDSSVAVRVGL